MVGQFQKKLCGSIGRNCPTFLPKSLFCLVSQTPVVSTNLPCQAFVLSKLFGWWDRCCSSAPVVCKHKPLHISGIFRAPSRRAQNTHNIDAVDPKETLRCETRNRRKGWIAEIAFILVRDTGNDCLLYREAEDGRGHMQMAVPTTLTNVSPWKNARRRPGGHHPTRARLRKSLC